MLKTRRRVALGITAAASVASMIALAVPAEAVTTPDWPTAGRVPTGCNPAVAISGGLAAWFYTFTDSTVPTISATRISSNATNVTVLPPAGAVVSMSAKVSDPCSGVQTVITYIARNRVILTALPLVNTTADPFTSWWTTSLGTLRPDDAVGVWTEPSAFVQHRYDSFVLDQDFKIGAPPALTATSPVNVAGSWALAKSYILRAMTLSNTLSAAKVKKGKTVKATAVLKMATNAGYVADASDKVVVQTKVGTGKWISNATLTTNASGVVSYSFVLTATTQVRFLHNRVLSGKYTNAVTSVIKTVTKA